MDNALSDALSYLFIAKVRRLRDRLFVGQHGDCIGAMR
jgi:cobalamin synthase